LLCRYQKEILIGITKQFLSNNFKIKEPKIAETMVLPDDLFGLENLKDVLTMEAWREHLTPTERCDLRSFLPEGKKNNTVVEFLLSGKNFDFGNLESKALTIVQKLLIRFYLLPVNWKINLLLLRFTLVQISQVFPHDFIIILM